MPCKVQPDPVQSLPEFRGYAALQRAGAISRIPGNPAGKRVYVVTVAQDAAVTLDVACGQLAMAADWNQTAAPCAVGYVGSPLPEGT